MSKTFSYKTILAPAESIFKDKGSKFIAFAYPVESEIEIKVKLEALGKRYFDARHHCFAYILGPDGNKYRAFDDGEPNHSAGDPILGQIRSRRLTDALVVVVRYFGGTKLGVSGLINAYKTATADALDKAGSIEKAVTRHFTLSYDYASTPEIMKMIRDFDLRIEKQSFEAHCELRAWYNLQDEASFKERLALLVALGHVVRLQYEPDDTGLPEDRT